MRSPRYAASPRSCVTSSTVFPSVRKISLEVVLQARRESSGRARRAARRAAAPPDRACSARISPTRWRCPPDSCAGVALEQLGGEMRRARASSSSRARDRVGSSQPRSRAMSATLLGGGEVREQAAFLDHVAESSRAPRRRCRGATRRSSSHDGAAVRRDQPDDQAQHRRLAAPARPDQRDALAARDLERGRLERRLAVVALEDAVEADHVRGAAHASPSLKTGLHTTRGAQRTAAARPAPIEPPRRGRVRTAVLACAALMRDVARRARPKHRTQQPEVTRCP